MPFLELDEEAQVPYYPQTFAIPKEQRLSANHRIDCSSKRYHHLQLGVVLIPSLCTELETFSELLPLILASVSAAENKDYSKSVNKEAMQEWNNLIRMGKMYMALQHIWCFKPVAEYILEVWGLRSKYVNAIQHSFWYVQVVNALPKELKPAWAGEKAMSAANEEMHMIEDVLAFANKYKENFHEGIDVETRTLKVRAWFEWYTEFPPYDTVLPVCLQEPWPKSLTSLDDLPGRRFLRTIVQTGWDVSDGEDGKVRKYTAAFVFASTGFFSV